MNRNDLTLSRIRARAQLETHHLACRLVHAAPDETEGIVAQLEFSRWLIGACDDAMGGLATDHPPPQSTSPSKST